MQWLRRNDAVSAISFLLVVLGGCEIRDRLTSSAHNPPFDPPSDPLPVDGAVNQELTITIRWVPADRTRMVDVYFAEDDDSLRVIVEDHVGTKLQVGPLEYDTSYNRSSQEC